MSTRPAFPCLVVVLTQVVCGGRYPPEIQVGLLEKLDLKDVVDGYVSSYDVADGRPYPYMIYRLMEDCGISDVSRVCKVAPSTMNP